MIFIMLVTLLCISVILILLFAYYRVKYTEHYWKQRGVAFHDKNKFGGPYLQFLKENRSFFEILKDIYYQHYDAPAVGLGSFFDQTLYVKDPINMLHISQVDFYSFYHRGIPITEDDILANNILWLNGPKWKLLRQTMSPLFTAAKLKKMYYIIDKSAQDFVEFLKQHPDKLNGDTFDIISHFCSVAVSAAVFGIGTVSTFDSPLRKRIQAALLPTPLLNLKFSIGGISDVLYKGLGLKLFGQHEQFFVDTIKKVTTQRENEGVQRHDFVDLGVNLKKNGAVQDPETGLSLEITDQVLAAQAFILLFAGIEPTSAAMFATMMELGRHPEILKKVHTEIDAVFEKYNDKLTYDAIGEVEFLDKVFKECLRLHTPIGFLSRQCMKDTVLPVGHIPVEKGVKILTPIFEIHHDPKYYPKPEVFDPDRFSRPGEINEMTYLPFGKGNRYCIGARYARVQLLCGLIHVLKQFTLNTYVRKGGIKYKKEQNQVRIMNVDIELIPRNK